MGFICNLQSHSWDTEHSKCGNNHLSPLKMAFAKFLSQHKVINYKLILLTPTYYALHKGQEPHTNFLFLHLLPSGALPFPPTVGPIIRQSYKLSVGKVSGHLRRWKWSYSRIVIVGLIIIVPCWREPQGVCWPSVDEQKTESSGKYYRGKATSNRALTDYFLGSFSQLQPGLLGRCCRRYQNNDRSPVRKALTHQGCE